MKITEACMLSKGATGGIWTREDEQELQEQDIRHIDSAETAETVETVKQNKRATTICI